MTINRVPNRLISISQINEDSWNFDLNVNRALWRKMTFKEQHSITSSLSAIQADLDEKLRELHLELNIELELKEHEKNAETNQETDPQHDPETDPQHDPETDSESPNTYPENNFIPPTQRQAKKTGKG